MCQKYMVLNPNTFFHVFHTEVGMSNHWLLLPLRRRSNSSRQFDSSTKEDMWILSFGGDRKPYPFVRTPFDQTFARARLPCLWKIDKWAFWRHGRTQSFEKPTTRGPAYPFTDAKRTLEPHPSHAWNVLTHHLLSVPEQTCKYFRSSIVRLSLDSPTSLATKTDLARQGHGRERACWGTARRSTSGNGPLCLVLSSRYQRSKPT